MTTSKPSPKATFGQNLANEVFEQSGQNDGADIRISRENLAASLDAAYQAGIEAGMAPRPIAEAPKDGSSVLVNDTTPGWTPWVMAKWLQGEEWSGWIYDDDVALDNNPCGPNPTHFLRLPPPLE